MARNAPPPEQMIFPFADGKGCPLRGRGGEIFKETAMHKLILAAAISAVLAGCAGGGSHMARDGGTYSDPYRSHTGSPSDWSAPYYGDRYWPPVVPGQAFPPQIMDGDSHD